MGKNVHLLLRFGSEPQAARDENAGPDHGKVSAERAAKWRHSLMTAGSAKSAMERKFSGASPFRSTVGWTNIPITRPLSSRTGAPEKFQSDKDSSALISARPVSVSGGRTSACTRAGTTNTAFLAVAS